LQNYLTNMKMKILIIIILICCIFGACKDEKNEEKTQQTALFKLHDGVMGKSEAVMKNKMAVDSLIKKGDPDMKKTARLLLLNVQLSAANDKMETWMHTFNPDYTGKSHTEVMEYLHNQRLTLLKIDSLMKSAVQQSNDYLKTK